MKRRSLNQKLRTSLFIVLALWGGFNSNAQTISTFAGNGNSGYKGEGQLATKAEINGQTGATMDRAGNMYITDFNNNRVRKISPSGIITTIAGCENPGYSGDGGPATAAKLAGPSGIVLDASGNIYFAERGNNCIRKIDVNGNISTMAGTGDASGGYSGNGGPAVRAQLQGPGALAIDAAGNIYVADCDNNCIRKINTAGIISLYAGSAFKAGTGTGAYGGDGGNALQAYLNQPSGIALDASGNLFIADCFNHCIRKVTTNGIITTVAGNRTAGYSGDLGNAKLAEINYPYGVAVDGNGNIYIGDHGNNRIRMVNKAGIISTIAGNGNADFSGDGGAAANAALNNPTFVCADNSNNLYVGDNENNRIRYIYQVPQSQTITTTAAASMPKTGSGRGATSNVSATSSASVSTGQ